MNGMIKIIFIAIFIFLILGLIYFRKKNWIKKKKREIHQEIEKLKRKENKRKKSFDDIFYLATKYHQGIPEIITESGKVLKGMRPNYKKAIYYYEKLLNTNYHYIVLLPLADIYHYGYGDYQEFLDLKKAREYYTQASYSPDVDIRLEATEKLYHMNYQQNMVPVSDPDEINNQYTVLKETPPVPLPNIQASLPEKNEIRNDTQNVHDTGVVNSVKIIVDNLRKETPINIPAKKCIDDIKVWLNKDISEDEHKKRALKTFERMTNVNGIVSNANCDEIEILTLIWNKIDQLKKDKKEDGENVQNNLLIQLCEAQEHGETVCAQGRFNHVLACLDVLKEGSQIKPVWAIKQEMMHKASLLTNEELSETEFRYKLKKEFFKEYVVPGLVSEKFINNEIDSWF